MVHGSSRTRARFSENQTTVLREPDHGSPRTKARFSENQRTVLQEPEHSSPRTRARFSENQSMVLREPEHSFPRTGARFSENQSAPKLENRKTSPCSPRAPNLLHVLPSRMVGWNDLCTPADSVSDPDYTVMSIKPFEIYSIHKNRSLTTWWWHKAFETKIALMQSNQRPQKWGRILHIDVIAYH